MITVYLILWSLSAIICLYLVRRLAQFLKNRYILKKIPGPKGHWLWGNLSDVISRDPVNLKRNKFSTPPSMAQTDDLFNLLRQLAKDYWPIYRFNGFTVTTINLLHPSDVEIVLSNMKHLSKSRIYTLLETWLGKGLLTSTVFNEETEKLVKQIEEHCHEPYIDVIQFITQMTLQSIGETAMGLSNIDEVTQEKYKNSIYKLGKILLTKLTRPWNRIPYVYYFTKLRQEEVETTEYLHNFAYSVIKSREHKLLNDYQLAGDKKIEATSYSGKKLVRMLDLLLIAKMNGDQIDLEGIREEVDTFMFEKIVSQEIIDVMGSKHPTYDDLHDLKYTERVIKETLRLYPSVPFISRVASEDFTTHTGYFVPKGSILHMHIFDMHRDPRIYHNPLKFDPDRFLTENSQRHPFGYIPFSAGPRNCIGQRFAILELKAVLCGILRKFSLESIDRPEDISFLPDLVLRPKTPIRIKFVRK
ncbi:hypothetical protein NQ318_010517 [Aromia moschata]|uniref:Cytochrome P450 n=1 Tax=Aromia moschata TaxID=1265417 RepID=A0AAV8YH35_9CUCU|nr:hypothetical protein NQ318_010517 [Aromia moschata]